GILKVVSKEFGRTVIMVTHDPRIAAYSDRIIFLKDGKVVDETLLDRKNGDRTSDVAEKIRAMSK
ncbi:MAG: lipoprotein-releasing system ATP-binding protein LolD, partial [Anaerolineales bacterium]|nr:lipoprotein-releasing system ATP-binding protein LolD [Anaerolineales bacterium]